MFYYKMFLRANDVIAARGDKYVINVCPFSFCILHSNFLQSCPRVSKQQHNNNDQKGPILSGQGARI